MKIASIKRAVWLTAMALPLLQGCISGGVRSHDQALGQYDQAALDNWLVAGKTSKKEVLTRLGPPAEPADFSHAASWRYVWSEQTRVVVIPAPTAILGKERILSLNFADNGNLVSYSFNEGKARLQKGDNPVGVFRVHSPRS